MQNLEQQMLDERGGEGLKVGIVIAQFNKDIADSMRLACTNHLIALGVSAEDITSARRTGGFPRAGPCCETYQMTSGASVDFSPAFGA